MNKIARIAKLVTLV